MKRFFEKLWWLFALIDFLGILPTIDWYKEQNHTHWKIIMNETWQAILMFVFTGILFLILLFLLKLIFDSVFKPKNVKSFLNNIRKKTKEMIKEHNNKTTDRHLDKNGNMAVTTIDWPIKSDENRDWKILKLISENHWSKFRPVLESINRNEAIYNFVKFKSEQYNFPFSELHQICYKDETTKKKAITSLINMALDEK